MPHLNTSIGIDNDIWLSEFCFQMAESLIHSVTFQRRRIDSRVVTQTAMEELSYQVPRLAFLTFLRRRCAFVMKDLGLHFR